MGKQRKSRRLDIRRDRKAEGARKKCKVNQSRSHWQEREREWSETLAGSKEQRTVTVKHGWMYGKKRGVWWKREPGNEWERWTNEKEQESAEEGFAVPKRGWGRAVEDGEARSITNFSAELQLDCFPISPGHNELAWIALLLLLLLSLSSSSIPLSLLPPHVSQGSGAGAMAGSILYTHTTHTQARVLQQDAKACQYHCYNLFFMFLYDCEWACVLLS